MANVNDTMPLTGNRMASIENTIAIQEKTWMVRFFLSQENWSANSKGIANALSWMNAAEYVKTKVNKPQNPNHDKKKNKTATP